MMKALEFETELTNNTIAIPANLQEELFLSVDKHVRVIVLIDDAKKDEDEVFKNMLKDQFLKGYDATDAIYDDL